MTKWKLIDEYGSGKVLETIEGSFTKANRRKLELVEELGSDVILSQSM